MKLSPSRKSGFAHTVINRNTEEFGQSFFFGFPKSRVVLECCSVCSSDFVPFHLPLWTARSQHLQAGQRSHLAHYVKRCVPGNNIYHLWRIMTDTQLHYSAVTFWKDMTNLPDRRAVISLLWLSPTPVPAGYVLLGSFQRGTGAVPSDQLTHTCLSLWLEDVINSKSNNSFKLCKTMCPTAHFFEYRAS